jgi:hypothetical protein
MRSPALQVAAVGLSLLVYEVTRADLPSPALQVAVVGLSLLVYEVAAGFRLLVGVQRREEPGVKGPEHSSRWREAQQFCLSTRKWQRLVVPLHLSSSGVKAVRGMSVSSAHCSLRKKWNGARGLREIRCCALGRSSRPPPPHRRRGCRGGLIRPPNVGLHLDAAIGIGT